jgi:hypothetical protein
MTLGQVSAPCLHLEALCPITRAKVLKELLRESDVEDAGDTTLAPRNITYVTRAEYVRVSLEDVEDERVDASPTQ